MHERWMELYWAVNFGVQQRAVNLGFTVYISSCVDKLFLKTETYC